MVGATPWTVGQRAAAWHASRSTWRPRSWISPARSATGMNRSGGTSPSVQSRQRHRASYPRVRPDGRSTIGWKCSRSRPSPRAVASRTASARSSSDDDAGSRSRLLADAFSSGSPCPCGIRPFPFPQTGSSSYVCAGHLGTSGWTRRGALLRPRPVSAPDRPARAAGYPRSVDTAATDATTAATAPAGPGAEPSESELPEQMQVRLDKRARLLAEGREPYAVGVPRTHTLAEVRSGWGWLE